MEAIGGGGAVSVCGVMVRPRGRSCWPVAEEGLVTVLLLISVEGRRGKVCVLPWRVRTVSGVWWVEVAFVVADGPPLRCCTGGLGDAEALILCLWPGAFAFVMTTGFLRMGVWAPSSASAADSMAVLSSWSSESMVLLVGLDACVLSDRRWCIVEAVA